MYQCEDVKSGRVKCTDCFRFLESDKCLEDSVLMPTYKPLHPNREPSRFVPKIRNPSLVLVEPEKSSLMTLESKEYSLVKTV
jgi:hypothetical protein